MAVGQLIREALDAEGYGAQIQLARAVGVRPQTVSKCSGWFAPST